MVLLSTYFLHESDPRRDHQRIVLYSFAHALALHLAVKILLQIFHMYEDLSTLTAYICQFIISHKYVGPHFVTQPILLSENVLYLT